MLPLASPQSKIQSVGHLFLPALVVVVALFTLGVSAALTTLGVLLLVQGMRILFPRLGFSASLAAGILLEIGLLLGSSAALAFLLPYPHSHTTGLLILSAPIPLGVALILFGLKFRVSRSLGFQSASKYALIFAAIVLVATKVIGDRGPGFDMAWAMSGDSRNHLLIVRDIMSTGGITFEKLQEYPAAINALSAIFASSTSRIGLSAGELLLVDVHALVATYSLSIIAVGALSIAALHHFIPERLTNRIPLGIGVILLFAAATSASPILLGTALADGFLTGYGALVGALISVNLALRCVDSSRGSIPAYILLAPAMVFTFLSWTLLAIVGITLSLAVILLTVFQSQNDQTANSKRVQIWAAASANLLCIAAIAIVTIRNFDRLKSVFALTGAITPQHVLVLPILFFLIMTLFFSRSKSISRIQLGFLASVILVGTVVIAWLYSLSLTGFAPTYYSDKTVWLVTGSLLWASFLPGLYVIIRMSPAEPVRKFSFTPPITALAYSCGIASVIGMSTTVADPLPLAWQGWNAPSAQIVSEVVSNAQNAGPFLFWQNTDPGNDRLGNFWAIAAWDTDESGAYLPPTPELPSGISYWAYMASGQNLDLCEPLLAYPDLTLISNTADLKHQISEECKIAQLDDAR